MWARSTDDAQRALFEAALERAADWWPGTLVTALEPLSVFYPAEEYHQDFFAKNPAQGYCVAVVSGKVAKVRSRFAQFLATEA